jgi:hypothetical protein
MSGPSVELDDNAFCQPQDIDFDRHVVQLDRRVPFRRWQIFTQDKGSEAVLEVAAGVGNRVGRAFDCDAEVLRAAASRREHVADLREVDDAQELGFTDRPVDLVRLCDGGEVDERPLGSGARDPSVLRAFARCDRRTTGDKESASAVCVRRDDLGLAGIRPDAPERGGRAMTENRASPQASTAARQRPSCGIRVCPTAYTPRWITCRRPARIRRAIAPGSRPSSCSRARETTPYCLPASSAIAASMTV